MIQFSSKEIRINFTIYANWIVCRIEKNAASVSSTARIWILSSLERALGSRSVRLTDLLSVIALGWVALYYSAFSYTNYFNVTVFQTN